MQVLVINGPNLNMLGKRDPDIYGQLSLSDIEQFTRKSLKQRNMDIVMSWFQSNHEGEIVDKIQQADQNFDAIIINPGGYTHSSVAILDALQCCKLSKVEVHISLVSSRESFRQQRITTAGCDIAIEGAGKFAYLLAIEYIDLLHTEN